MWIRTQDKERLIDCKDIEIFGLAIFENKGFENTVKLATYPTQQRCLEVLDEIQQAIKDNIQLPSLLSNLTQTIAILHENGESAMENKEFLKLLEKVDNSCVYQMPEE